MKRGFRMEWHSQIPFEVDITEIDGFDNLHHAEGILKKFNGVGGRAIWGRPDLVSDKWKYGGTFICSLRLRNLQAGGSLWGATVTRRRIMESIFISFRPPMFYPQSTGEWGIQGGILPRMWKSP